MTQKFTAEEVRALAARLLEENNPGDQAEIDAGLMLNAYADTLSKPADSGRVVDVSSRLRGLLAEIDPPKRPATDPNIKLIAGELRSIAALAAQGQGDSDGMCNEEHPERRCVCREEFGYRVCEPASPAGVPEKKDPETCNRDWANGWNECRLAVLTASPARVPDDLKPSPSNELLPEYRIGYSEGKYGQPEAWWPIWRDGYITNGAFPTKVHAILAAWQHAHRRLADGMEGVQRIVSRLAAPSAPEGDGGGE